MEPKIIKQNTETVNRIETKVQLENGKTILAIEYQTDDQEVLTSKMYYANNTEVDVLTPIADSDRKQVAHIL